MQKPFYTLALLLLMAVLAACTTQYDRILQSSDYKLKYEKAKEYYELEKYERAATLFEQSAMFFRGSKQDDSLNFLLAKSYYRWGDVYTAEYYFDQFRNTFPRSAFAEEAGMLRVASIYAQTNRYELDQTPAHKTLAAIDEFLYTYPASEYKKDCDKIKEDLLQRLDEKQYESAKLYYHIGDYKASTTALRTALKDYPESRYREEVLYLLVASAYKYAENSFRHLQKDRYQSVLDAYYNFVSEFPESKHRAEVERMNKDAIAKIGSSRAEEPEASTKPIELPL